MAGDARERAIAHLDAARRARRHVDPVTHVAEVHRMEEAIAELPHGDQRELLQWAATAERLRDITFTVTDEAELRAAAATATAGLAAVPRDRPDVRGRLHLALGLIPARLRGSDWAAEAKAQLTTAARHLIEAGERVDAAAALSMLAYTVQPFSEGLLAAQDSLTQAIGLSDDASMRAGLLSQRAQHHIWLGQLDQAQHDVDAAWALTSRDAEYPAATYLSWVAAAIASLRGHRAVVEHWARRGDERRGFADATVVSLWYDALVTDALARVGAVEAARARLEAIMARADEEPTAAGIAQIAVEARWGDRRVAEQAWEAISGLPDLEPWWLARLRLLVAHAHGRDGGDPGPVAAEAFDLCEGLEEPALLLVIEPEIAKDLLPAAAAAGSVVAARLQATHRRWFVRLLGGFEVRRPDGDAVELTGRMRRLVTRLALSSTPVTRQEVSRWLWADSSQTAASGGRLRQLLYRTRTLLPDLLVTQRDGRLRMAKEVVVDLDRFTAAAARAMGAGDDVLRVAAAREALEHLGGELLPDEAIDASWLDEPRAELTTRTAWIHSVLAQHAQETGHSEVALEHAQAALRLEPADEATATLAIDLLRRAGLRGQAVLLSRQTDKALAALNLEPGPRLREAQQRLER